MKCAILLFFIVLFSNTSYAKAISPNLTSVDSVKLNYELAKYPSISLGLNNYNKKRSDKRFFKPAVIGLVSGFVIGGGLGLLTGDVFGSKGEVALLLGLSFGVVLGGIGLLKGIQDSVNHKRRSKVESTRYRILKD